MTRPRVPYWQKLLMLALVASFIVMLSVFVKLRRGGRAWDPNKPVNQTSSRPA